MLHRGAKEEELWEPRPGPLPRRCTEDTGALIARLTTAVTVIVAGTVTAGCSTSEPAPDSTVEVEEVHLDAIREVLPDVEECMTVRVPGEAHRIVSPPPSPLLIPMIPLLTHF